MLRDVQKEGAFGREGAHKEYSAKGSANKMEYSGSLLVTDGE